MKVKMQRIFFSLDYTLAERHLVQTEAVMLGYIFTSPNAEKTQDAVRFSFYQQCIIVYEHSRGLNLYELFPILRD